MNNQKLFLATFTLCISNYMQDDVFEQPTSRIIFADCEESALLKLKNEVEVDVPYSRSVSIYDCTISEAIY